MDTETPAWYCGHCQHGPLSQIYNEVCLECPRMRDQYARYSPPAHAQLQSNDREYMIDGSSLVPQVQIYPPVTPESSSLQDTDCSSGQHEQPNPTSLPLATYINQPVEPWTPWSAGQSVFRLDSRDAAPVKQQTRQPFTDERKAEMRMLKQEGGACSVCKKNRRRCSVVDCPYRQVEFGSTSGGGSAAGAKVNNNSRQRNLRVSSDYGHDGRKGKSSGEGNQYSKSTQNLPSSQRHSTRHARTSTRNLSSGSGDRDTRSEPGSQHPSSNLSGHSSLQAPSYTGHPRCPSSATISEQLDFDAYNGSSSSSQGPPFTDFTTFGRDLESLQLSNPNANLTSRETWNGPTRDLSYLYNPAGSLLSPTYPPRLYLDNTTPSYGQAFWPTSELSVQNNQPAAGFESPRGNQGPSAVFGSQYNDSVGRSYRPQAEPTGTNQQFPIGHPSGNTSASMRSFGSIVDASPEATSYFASYGPR